MGLFRRRTQPLSIESEQERLHAIRVAAEEELGRLRRELTERVAIVERRERELADTLAKARRGLPRDAEGEEDATVTHAQVNLAARARELERREKELAAREQAALENEARLADRAISQAPTPDERLAQIEARLAALKEAEKAFARTQAELAARSEALASREAELAERERVLHGAGPPGAGLSRAELEELDERLRRLEAETRVASRGFDDELRALERRGLRG